MKNQMLKLQGRGRIRSTRGSKEWWVQIKAKITIVDQQISNLIKHLDNLRTLIQLGKVKDQAAVDLNIHWLMVELDIGGNIRMEVGNSKDAWFKSCIDLVMSRFFPVDFVPFSYFWNAGVVGHVFTYTLVIANVEESYLFLQSWWGINLWVVILVTGAS